MQYLTGIFIWWFKIQSWLLKRRHYNNKIWLKMRVPWHKTSTIRHTAWYILKLCKYLVIGVMEIFSAISKTRNVSGNIWFCLFRLFWNLNLGFSDSIVFCFSYGYFVYLEYNRLIYCFLYLYFVFDPLPLLLPGTPGI